ncbi:hypothetical protein V6N12_003068 [Hibiscus sabdariffa]|uniref:Uncharacterized protein n=1 Tax=Hibiscus sabdariffa TaxID=183260 RepID=A0ABR2EAU4_9ROSI
MTVEATGDVQHALQSPVAQSSKFKKNNHTAIFVFENADPNVLISASRLPPVPHDAAMLEIPSLVSDSSGKMLMKGIGFLYPYPGSFPTLPGHTLSSLTAAPSLLEVYFSPNTNLAICDIVCYTLGFSQTSSIIAPLFSELYQAFGRASVIISSGYFFHDDGDRNVQRFSKLLDPSIIPHVMGVLPPFIEDRCDMLAWMHTPTRALTVASAYAGLCLMTNVECVRRSLLFDSSCLSCGCYNKTVLHILRDCPLCVASSSPLFLRLTMRSSLALLWSIGSSETSMP